MLTQLTISNFAIIDNLEINFKEGLTVLTGETGAGKSIIVDALDFLFTQRASTDLIKTGTNKAIVEGTFSTGASSNNTSLRRWFETNGFEIFEKQIIISRELTKEGSKARINGTVANVSHLSFLKEFLLDIHEQSGQVDLLKIEKQLEILDDFGDKSHKDLLTMYKKAYDEYKEQKTKLENCLANSEQISKKIDYLRFQISEIKAADIKDPSEEEQLKTKREILLNKKELIENTSTIYELINQEGNNGLISILAQIKKLLEKSSEHDESFESYLEEVNNITSEIKELSSFVKDYSESVSSDEDALKETEERLDLFYNLKRKYGKSLGEIKEYLQKIENELTNIETLHETSLLEKQFINKQKEINELAEKLTKSREQITREFVEKVNVELPKLGFKHAVFVVEFTECELSQNGKEQIQFLFTANPDESPKPLVKVASGGELSRIMLAIKSIVGTTVKPARTVIFDEIDIGTSGEITANIARKLYKISRGNQVISITHQPIIAAMADCHFMVEKKISDCVTQIFIKEVTQNEKIDAISMLLTPEKEKSRISQDAKEFARSLIDNARKEMVP